MAELGHNFKIQKEKLFLELKAAFPNVPDPAVRQVMKQNRNDKLRCEEDLRTESLSHGVGRYNLMNKGNRYGGGQTSRTSRTSRSSRRFSMGALSLSGSSEWSGSNVSSSYIPRQTRTNSLSESNFPKFWQGFYPQSCSESEVSDDTINNCDEICDTNDDQSETEKENDRVAGRLIGEISECGEEENENIMMEEEESDAMCMSESQDDENNNNLVLRDISNTPEPRLRHPPTPRTLCLGDLAQVDSLTSVPTVVLTPDSPPQQHSSRKVKTLYTPDQTKVETTVIERDDVFFPPESLEEEIQKSISDLSDDVIICGENDTVSKSYIDILPGLAPINLPFGSTDSISEGGGLSVSRSTTSVSQGKVHVVKDVGDGNVSIATTTFCGVRHSVLSTTVSGSESKPSGRCKTVLYTVNRKPIICENPFRKVFTARKEFYQSKEVRDKSSPETSSKRLIWRHSNCKRIAESPPRCSEGVPPQKYFTLNANIQPFDPFIIKHDLSSGLSLSRSPSSQVCNSVNLTLCPSSSPPVEVEMLPDGSGLRYQKRLEDEEGLETCLEVKVGLEGSTITTTRTGKENSSNQISVQLVEGGSSVNIQTREKKERPTSLLLPDRRASSRQAQSLYQARGSSPQSLPRYNSLPSFNTVSYGGSSGGEFMSHPRDEEKRLAFTRALLSHQMDQLLKLNKQLAEGKKEVEEMKTDIRDLETKLKQQEMMIQEKKVMVEVRQLETDISGLRGNCDDMSRTVSSITAGKVPLGETSIKFENYLTAPPVPEDTRVTPPITAPSSSWACSECTFSNHMDLEHCEMCEMPRIQLAPPPHRDIRHTPQSPPRVFSQPRYEGLRASSRNRTPTNKPDYSSDGPQSY